MSILVIRPEQALPELDAGLRIAGVDEAGRGPLAGPVVAAAVILPDQYHLPGLNDSKKLDADQREALFEPICQQATAWAIAEVDAQQIDRLNIFQATLQAMFQALNRLAPKPEAILVDGKHCPPWPGLRMAVIQGDGRVPAISAASVLAKVHRDRLLQQLDGQYPQYGFARHKGYPTRAHLEALREHGPCPVHRMSYRPVREAMEQRG